MFIENEKLMLYSEIIAVCSEIHTKHINALWAEHRISVCSSWCYIKEFFSIKVKGNYLCQKNNKSIWFSLSAYLHSNAGSYARTRWLQDYCRLGLELQTDTVEVLRTDSFKVGDKS